MFKKLLKKSKFHVLSRISSNLLQRKNLIIFIGTKGVSLFAINRKKVIRSQFISKKNQDNIDYYLPFLNKCKRYHTSFLIDNERTELRHEIVPVLGALIKLNPVEKYMDDKLAATDVAAFNVYNISTKNGEIWETTVAKSTFEPPFEFLLEHIVTNTSNYSGTYFLHLEFESIINTILKKLQKKEQDNDLQVFVVVTKTSDIRVCVKHKQNIMYEQRFAYPEDKSDEFLLGVIEQAINDDLLKFKDYISSLNLHVCLIILADQELCDLFLQNENFAEHSKIATTAKKLKISKLQSTERFVDKPLVALFNQNKMHIGYNKPLKSISQLNIIHLVVFKPLIILIAGLVITSSVLFYKTFITKRETKAINRDYYHLSQEYRKIKKERPEVVTISQLAELHKLQETLEHFSNTPSPIYLAKQLHNISTFKINISKVKWHLVKPLNENHHNSFVMRVFLEFRGEIKTKHEGEEVLENYVNHIRSILPKLKFRLSIDNVHSINLTKHMLIPAQLVISGTLSEDEVKKRSEG